MEQYECRGTGNGKGDFCDDRCTSKWQRYWKNGRGTDNIYLKLLFYSVISNYWTACELGLIKKTGTVAVKGLLMDWKKNSDVLGLNLLLFSQDFEFGLYIQFGLLYPSLDVLFGFG